MVTWPPVPAPCPSFCYSWLCHHSLGVSCLCQWLPLTPWLWGGCPTLPFTVLAKCKPGYVPPEPLVSFQYFCQMETESTYIWYPTQSLTENQPGAPGRMAGERKADPLGWWKGSQLWADFQNWYWASLLLRLGDKKGPLTASIAHSRLCHENLCSVLPLLLVVWCYRNASSVSFLYHSVLIFHVSILS